MTLRTRNRRTRTGAHRAPRVSSPVRESQGGKAGDRKSKARVFGVGLRSRATLVRASAVVIVAALVGVGLVHKGVPSAEPTVDNFLLDWESRQYTQAAGLTTGQPRAVAKALAGAYAELDATGLELGMQSITQLGNTAHAEFNASVGLGSTGLTWSYLGKFNLVYGDSGWRVAWSPSVIEPQMTTGDRLAVVTIEPGRAQILDSAGRPLAVRSLVYQVGVYPEQLANPARTAAGLAAVTQIPAEQIEGQIGAAISATFLSLLTLSPASYAKVRDKLADIPGVIIRPERERLFNNIAPDVVGTVGTETASVLRDDGASYRPGATVGLSGLEQTFQGKLTGTPLTGVLLLNAKGQAVQWVHRWQNAPGRAVRTTLDWNVQLAADHALAGLPNSAAIVAVQPGSGQILAVASGTGPGEPALNPLAGKYQPGQAFTIVSSAAILTSGERPGDPLPCHQVNSVDGRTFVNDPPEQYLGASFRQDFADACATAFAGLSMSLSAADLAGSAQKFGVGGWQLPGSSYFAGSLGQLSGGSGLAAGFTGSGGVRVSPLGMALVAAVVDSGKWHGPSLVTGHGDPSSSPRGVASAEVLSLLRSMMRVAVRSGSAKAADVASDVYGQVGNAPFGKVRDLRISWFVGYQGKVAFAVVELGKSAYASAAPLAGRFLRNIQTGS
jgi:cell division protein FtsI/penicillin-binding protein 2